jgi:hypothetical protein
MRMQRGLVGLGCVVAAVAVMALAVAILRPGEPVAAGTVTPVQFFIDCDPAASGIQSDCAYPSGTTSVAVDVVLQNRTGGVIGLSALGLAVRAAPASPGAFDPAVAACGAEGLDCNPDFNDAIPGGFTCGSPPPATDADPSEFASESSIGCWTGVPATPFLADGDTLVLAAVHYVTTDVSANVWLENTTGANGAAVWDEEFSELGSCGPTLNVAAECFGARVQVGVANPTNTPVPTSTNTPSPTPTVTGTPPTATVTPTATAPVFLTVTPTPIPATAQPSDWKAVAPLPTPRAFLAGVTMPDGDIIVMGGGVLDFEAGVINRYDPPTNTWSTIGGVEGGTWLIATALGPDGLIYKSGGVTAGSLPPMVYRYDASANTWTRVADLNEGRVQSGMATGADGRIYIVGGSGDGAVDLASVEAYDITADTWTEVAPLPSPRHGAAIVAGPGGQILAIGGAVGQGGPPLADVLIYDTETDTWTPGAPLHTARYEAGAALGADGLIYVVGGWTADGETASVERYNTALNTWEDASGLPFPTSGNFVAASGPSLYSIGGRQNSVAVDDVYRYTPVGDEDQDGVQDADDNCVDTYNPDQRNSDAAPRSSIGGPDDTTLANGDALGDACDLDADNDGLVGAAEVFGCWYGRAYSSPLSLTDPDTDRDGVIDGAECALGSDPSNALSRPSATAGTDSDGDSLPDSFEVSIGADPDDVDSDDDGITDGIEVKGYGTSPTSPNTDGDGCTDAQEIASVDGLSAVNSIDLQLIAQRFGLGNQWVHDIDKSGAINSIDLQLVAQNFAPASCASYWRPAVPVSPLAG